MTSWLWNLKDSPVCILLHPSVATGNCSLTGLQSCLTFLYFSNMLSQSPFSLRLLYGSIPWFFVCSWWHMLPIESSAPPTFSPLISVPLCPTVISSWTRPQIQFTHFFPDSCPSSYSLEGEKKKKKPSTVAYTRYQIRMLSLLSKHRFLVILKPICLFILTVTSTALAQTLLRTFIKSLITHLTPSQLLIIMPQRDLPQTQIQVYHLFFKILQKA